MQPLRDLAAHPKVQDLIRRASSLRTDLMDRLDDRLGGVAKRLNLVTRKEMKLVKRQVRELENQVTTLELQLQQERQRADRAEKELSDALKAAKPKPAPRSRKKADGDAAPETAATPEGQGDEG